MYIYLSILEQSLLHACTCMFADGGGSSSIDRRAVRGAFLSSSSRSAPPRDILLEEPDIFNPGTCIHVHVLHVQ